MKDLTGQALTKQDEYSYLQCHGDKIVYRVSAMNVGEPCLGFSSFLVGHDLYNFNTEWVLATSQIVSRHSRK